MHPAAGGPPVVVEKLASLMPLKGWEASVITTSLYCNDDGQTLLESIGQNIDLKVLPECWPRFMKRSRRAAQEIDEAIQRVDLVHLHTVWNPLNTIARKACQRHGLKYVLMPHGMLDPYSLRQKRWRKKIYLAAVERRNIQEASRLIFTTAQEQESARKCLPWLGSGEVIALGADCPPALSRETCIETFASRFPQALNRRCLLFLGRIHQKKGLERLLTILPQISQKHPDTLLVIAGSGEPVYVESIKSFVQTQGLERKVLFTGMLTGYAKYGALALAEAFLLPSKQENFAIAMAEAMHMAVPVIISNKVDSWPLVQQANAGFVIEEEQIEIGFAKRIDELLSHPEQARRLGKRGQNFARQYLTWGRAVEATVRLYQRILI